MTQDTNTTSGAADLRAEVAMIDAAMVEMTNITPPLKRSECARLLRAALAAGQATAAQQPDTAYAALPAECDSPELCAVSRACAGQFGTKRICASRGQAPAGLAVPSMSADEVNALPTAARAYIHQLATNTDPAGMVRENMQLRDTNAGLQSMYRKAADAAQEVVGCFHAAECEGLQAALAGTADEHLKDLVERRLMHALYAAQEVAGQAPAQPAPAAVDHDEDLLEKLYWEFDSQRKKTGEERLAFKVKMRFYASEFLRRSDGKMTFAQSVSDDMMNLADRLGSEFDDVDPRAWKHLLVYAPKAAPAQPAPQQEAQESCPTCIALARTVMLDQVSFDRKPDCYGIRQITDDEGVEEWEDIRTSPDVAREEANDMMATGRGEIYEVVPLYTTPQPVQAQAGAVPLTDKRMAKRTVTYVCPVCCASLERNE